MYAEDTDTQTYPNTTLYMHKYSRSCHLPKKKRHAYVEKNENLWSTTIATLFALREKRNHGKERRVGKEGVLQELMRLILSSWRAESRRDLIRGRADRHQCHLCPGRLLVSCGVAHLFKTENERRGACTRLFAKEQRRTGRWKKSERVARVRITAWQTKSPPR